METSLLVAILALFLPLSVSALSLVRSSGTRALVKRDLDACERKYLELRQDFAKLEERCERDRRTLGEENRTLMAKNMELMVKNSELVVRLAQRAERGD